MVSYHILVLFLSKDNYTSSMSYTQHPNTSSLPLLSEQGIDDARVTLEAISKAAAAARAGKMPSSEQLASIVQKLLKSNLLQPGLGSRVAGKIGGGES